MKRLYFDYQMKIKYSELASLCHFSFKCIPKNTARQRLVDLNIYLSPSVHFSRCTDSFDNIKLIGTVKEPHKFLEFQVRGEVEIDQLIYESEVDKNKMGMYKYPHGKNCAGEHLISYYNELIQNVDFAETRTDYEIAIYIMQRLHGDFAYKTGITNVNTTAEEAWNLGSGVCQDFAHIYIALLQMANIPARYVTGMMIGEGKSHAWVEFCWCDKWVGVDPTNNLLIDDCYIKIADGRDACDCEVNRGIMYGGGEQNQEIHVNMWKKSED